MADDDQITGVSQEQINNVIKLRTEMENLIRRKAQLAIQQTRQKTSGQIQDPQCRNLQRRQTDQTLKHN